MSCASRRNSIGHSYPPLTFLLPANGPARSDSAKTNSWLLLTVKVTYPSKTMRSHSWTSWSSRSTLANDSQSDTDNNSCRNSMAEKTFADDDHQRYDKERGREWFSQELKYPTQL